MFIFRDRFLKAVTIDAAQAYIIAARADECRWCHGMSLGCFELECCWIPWNLFRGSRDIEPEPCSSTVTLKSHSQKPLEETQ